jgi:hypothetical protein
MLQLVLIDVYNQIDNIVYSTIAQEMKCSR